MAALHASGIAAERQGFMQVVPVPARLAYKLIGHRQLTRETIRIRSSPASATRLHAAPGRAGSRGLHRTRDRLDHGRLTRPGTDHETSA